MNLFILDDDLIKNAEYHVDKHVVKMILEAAQLLCSAHWVTQAIGFTPRKVTPAETAVCKDSVTPDFYKLTHPNHPCAIWVRSSLDNFIWTYCYAAELNSEYGFRYGKSHKSMEVINRLSEPTLPKLGLTPFAQAMPDEYKHENAVTAYRRYYAAEKSQLFAWKNRDRPDWLPSEGIQISS
jgi:hypothetical protein